MRSKSVLANKAIGERGAPPAQEAAQGVVTRRRRQFPTLAIPLPSVRLKHFAAGAAELGAVLFQASRYFRQSRDASREQALRSSGVPLCAKASEHPRSSTESVNKAVLLIGSSHELVLRSTHDWRLEFRGGERLETNALARALIADNARHAANSSRRRSGRRAASRRAPIPDNAHSSFARFAC